MVDKMVDNLGRPPRSGDADPVFRAKQTINTILISDVSQMAIQPNLLAAVENTFNSLFGSVKPVVQPQTSLQQFSQAAHNLLSNFLESDGKLNPDQVEQSKGEFALAASRMETDAKIIAEDPSLIFQRSMVSQNAKDYRIIANNIPELINFVIENTSLIQFQYHNSIS